MIHVGTGGWNWIKDLKRYTELFKAVEINMSFYRVPKPELFERWADSVPDDFVFSVKLFQGFTHLSRLSNVDRLDRFIENMNVLGHKRGPLLVQLPPSLPFNGPVVAKFFAALRAQFDGIVVCEPRHQSWFNPDVEQILEGYRIARVAADPSFDKAKSGPGAWSGATYYRLHGSPTSETTYSKEFLQALAAKLLQAEKSGQVWCIFDNAAVYARENGLDLMKYITPNSH